jgi:hypothetical protein
MSFIRTIAIGPTPRQMMSISYLGTQQLHATAFTQWLYKEDR